MNTTINYNEVDKKDSNREQSSDIYNTAIESEIITDAVKLAPYIKGLLGDDIGLYITNLDKNLYCNHGQLKLAVKAGDPIKEGGTAYLTIKRRQRTVAKVGAEVYGIPYIGICQPLKDTETGKIVGTMITVTPIERQEKLNQVAEVIEGRVNSLSLATDNLSATSEELAAATEHLNSHSHSISEEIKKTDIIVSLINEIAEETHILGLNAAIEAARVGQLGGGFNVVAVEIRKLSHETQRSAKEILQTLQSVQKNTMDLTNSIEQILASTQQQAASAEEINAVASELSSVAQELKKQASDLLR
ncbi:methyl-accepting chemotaxis protein [Desulforamulus aquiferis]|uniref:Methyl-accepting chemotaxis protein n=1 Tax=Desulforamulus aquiferis TaxID=1397668 RepID=A0AAW7ZEP6_9FIRM|nr:methyl-accepting chemotaxis protein [Desulforamulus aquiferis]MDO7788198.1 methyl-accepting chemotaxis protein [Desulforamulus aquiferis]